MLATTSVDLLARRDESRRVHEHRHAHRLLVGGALVDQPVLAEREAVVAHVDDERVLELPLLLAATSTHAADAVVDGEQRLRVAPVVVARRRASSGTESRRRASCCAGCAPTSGTCPPSAASGAIVGGVGTGTSFSEPLCRSAGTKSGVHGLVREIRKNGLSRDVLPSQSMRVVGELVGDVALLRDALAVDVEHRGAGAWQVRALAAEADPVIEAGLRRVALAAHVPLADQRRLVAGLSAATGRKLGSPGGIGVLLSTTPCVCA